MSVCRFLFVHIDFSVVYSVVFLILFYYPPKENLGVVFNVGSLSGNVDYTDNSSRSSRPERDDSFLGHSCRVVLKQCGLSASGSHTW